jgi:hypothetical protein
MTKKLFLALLILLAGEQAMAQYGNYKYEYQSYFEPDKRIRTRYYFDDFKAYVNVGVGYAMPGLRSTNVVVGVPHALGVTPGNTFSQPQRISFNSGVRANLALGFMFTQYVGFEVAGNVGVTSDKYVMELAGNQTSTYGNDVKVTASSQYSSMVIPSLVFHYITGVRSHIYAKIGAAIPFMSDITYVGETREVDAAGNNIFYSSQAVVTPEMFVGVSGTLGGYTMINRNLRLYLDVNYTGLSLYSKSVAIKEYKVNGQDAIQSLSSEDITVTYNQATTNRPAVSKFVIPYSTLSVNLGMSFRL